MKVRYLLVCLFVVKQVIQQNAQEINGDILSRELNKVANSVGWSFLQVRLLIPLKTFPLIHVCLSLKQMIGLCRPLKSQIIATVDNKTETLGIFKIINIKYDRTNKQIK